LWAAISIDNAAENLSQLFDGEGSSHVAQTAAAKFLRRDHSHQSNFSCFGENFAGQFLVVIPFVRERRHFLLRKFFD
jgi:hypothetical protein